MPGKAHITDAGGWEMEGWGGEQEDESGQSPLEANRPSKLTSLNATTFLLKETLRKKAIWKTWKGDKKITKTNKHSWIFVRSLTKGIHGYLLVIHSLGLQLLNCITHSENMLE